MLKMPRGHFDYNSACLSEIKEISMVISNCALFVGINITKKTLIPDSSGNVTKVKGSVQQCFANVHCKVSRDYRPMLNTKIIFIGLFYLNNQLKQFNVLLFLYQNVNLRLNKMLHGALQCLLL